LRILLLRGEKLQGWQVYKALHSAIQRRGFDPEVPWKRKSVKGNKKTKDEDNREKEKNDGDSDEKENRKKSQEYEKKLEKITQGRKDRTYPCYYDAYKMGLWIPETDELKYIQKHEAKRARSNELAPPRTLVEKELRDLIDAAAHQFPALSGKADYIIYGPTGTPYASINPELRDKFGLKEGGETDWQGALSQKIPRFDNRMPDKCSLIPRYNVCRAHDHLAMQFTFLMKLKNMRYRDSDNHEQILTHEDIKSIFYEKRKDANKKKIECTTKGFTKREISEEIAKVYSITKTNWKKWLRGNKNGYPRDILKQGEKPVEAPKPGGRTRFCRPVMRLMRELILSGESPHQFYDTKLNEINNTDLSKGLVSDDIEFLLKMPDDWNNIYIPQFSLAEQYIKHGDSKDSAVQKLITKQRNPVIRHRMEIFKSYLDRLTDQYGVPGKVVIELVRQDFTSEKKKREFEKWQRENRKKAETARNEAKELGDNSYKGRLKIRLLKQQSYCCLYEGDDLGLSDLSALDIDHAVPQKGGYNGSDSMYNKVVTKASTNRKKGNRTPYEYLSTSGKWDAYCERLQKYSTSLGKKKVALLSSEHPEELDEKYTQLAETAWIARIARDIVCLTYGWQYGAKGENEKAIVVDGKMTANVRRHLKLNSLLDHGGETDPAKLEEKCRDDKRHHALDAMVISFIARNKPELPEGIHKERFQEWLEKVVPEQIAFKKPELEQTIYGKRMIYESGRKKEIAVKRENLKDIAYANSKYDIKKARKNTKDIIDPGIRVRIETFLDTGPDRDMWDSFIDDFRQHEYVGSKVRKVSMYAGELKEFTNLSKFDDRGQYRKAAKHRGQFVYIDGKGKPKVQPVYAFESKAHVKAELVQNGYHIVDFFFAGCLIELDNDIDLGNRVIPKGKYRLGTLMTNGQVKLMSTLPELKNPVGIARLLSHGFHRVR